MERKLVPLEQAQSDALQDRIHDAFEELFAPAVCALAGVVGEQMYQWGTGTLLRIADASLLVTAAHVIEKANAAGVTLAISDRAESTRGVLLGGCTMTASSNADVAIVELPPDVVAKLPNRRWVTLNDFDTVRPSVSDMFLLHGYPEAIAKTDTPRAIGCQSISFIARRLPDDGEERENFDGRIHVLFDGPKGNEVAYNAPAVMPSRLHGISGSTIWRVYSGEDPDLWAPNCIRISGIQTGVYDSGKIKGTIWQCVPKMIHDQFERLRPSLQLLLPRRGLPT